MITKGRRKSDNVRNVGRARDTGFTSFSDKQMSAHGALDGLRRKVLDEKVKRKTMSADNPFAKAAGAHKMDDAAKRDDHSYRLKMEAIERRLDRNRYGRSGKNIRQKTKAQ